MPLSPLHQLPNTYRAFYGAFPALRSFQQVLSCLYEQKNLASATLHAVFPQQAAALHTLLPALAARAWLRRSDGAQASWRGGWRYARALRARQIWSNFPDTEVVYVLEVDAEAVADVPASVVR